MKNLRLESVNVIDSQTLVASFSEDLIQTIGLSNVDIVSQSDLIPTPQILKVTVKNNLLNILVQPLSQLGQYIISFKSTDSVIFKSLNGDAILLQDGVGNSKSILGPVDPENPFTTLLSNYFADNIYNLDDTTLIGKFIQALSLLFAKGLFDIRQTKNENYLSYTVFDELKTRSIGPSDRLSEESAYEVLRVGKTKTGSVTTGSYSFDEFPDDVVSLRSTSGSERLGISSEDIKGKFNINDFILNLSTRFLIKLKSVKFTFTNGFVPYFYDIEKYGYQIKDSKYDSSFGFSYLVLEDNQIKLNDAILEDPLFAIDSILFIDVTFDYKNLGKVVDSESLTVTANLESVREVLPPIVNVFNLSHAPIVNAQGNIPVTNGIEFSDPNQPQGSDHPAFLNEIPFSFEKLPAKIGEFSVNYETGTIYVFGSDEENDGTGPFPPLVTYLYKYSYISEVDYVYDSDEEDLIAIPNATLLGSSAKVAFKYEEVLVPEIDFKANIHKEELNERIDNRLTSLASLKVKNTPITNVFRIFNETSGEIYKIVRWSDDTVYFNYLNQPNIKSITNEKVTFNNVFNELLVTDSELSTTVLSAKVLKILLQNNNIIGSSEDSIGSSFNTSVSFSDENIFKQERFFISEASESSNADRLIEIGDYLIDYTNGIVYILVSSSQDSNIGTINYKRNYIQTNNKHIISVDDIYNRINIFLSKNKTFDYTSFDDSTILVNDIDRSDEQFLNNTSGAPYILFNSKIGAFANASFVPGVTDQISLVRNIFEFEDLEFNKNPINFADSSTFSGKIITVGSKSFTEYNTVQYDGQFFIELGNEVDYLSSNITINVSVIRTSDSAQLYDGTTPIETGNPTKVILTENSPAAGEAVVIAYSFTINDLSRVVVDYSKGDFLVDYTYLADEIIVSYEYGDNLLDFRESLALSSGDNYYVTYKVGALRQALYNNFGTIIDIPILNTFDTSFVRERYRDALMAVLQSFINGPTVLSMRNLVEKISHVPPEIIETAFQNWSLGNSLLTKQDIKTSGSFQLLSGKYDNGVLINSEGQSISLPGVSNIKLEEGTLEFWAIPEWNGIDNEAEITLTILRNNIPLNPSEVFIGASEYHPEYVIDSKGNSTIVLTKDDLVSGSPNKNKEGFFIYYDKDISSNFNRWYVEYVDGYSDGYYDGYSCDGYTDFTVVIKTNGKFYNSKSSIIPSPESFKLTTGNSQIKFSFSSCSAPEFGLTFVADFEHYFFDYGKELNRNRISIFKDPSGYINFKVFDKNKNSALISADVSDWIANEKHHIATSWKLNTTNRRDEIHLFIDGQEVPNIIKYGGLSPYLHEKFRTIDPEEVVGFSDRPIVGSNDLVTTLGSDIVTSTINFATYGILVGDTIYIEESGFSESGYIILAVSATSLTLDTAMPLSLTDARFSINKITFDTVTEIDVYNNIAVSTVHSILNGSDLNTSIGSDIVTSSGTNFSSEGIVAGNLLRIDSSGFEKHYVIESVSGSNLILNDEMPSSNSSLDWFVYDPTEEEIPGVRAIVPSYAISRDDNYSPQLTLKANIEENDIILIKTLGLNNKKIKQKYFSWTDGYINILKTQLPTPISLDSLNIFHILLSSTAIGPSNSTLSLGIFTSNSIDTYDVSLSEFGRTLTISIAGDNIDFSTSVTVDVNGTVNGIPTTETLTFTENGKQDTTNLFDSLDNIVVTGKPINSAKNLLVVEVKEKYSILEPELNSSIYPVIRYSYQVKSGITLESSGTNQVTDTNTFFSNANIGDYLHVIEPLSDVGYYLISDISTDRHTITIDSGLNIFTDGIYEILRVNAEKSGFQNGYFFFEMTNSFKQPYYLNKGMYEFEYLTYLSLPFDPIDGKIWIGTSFDKEHQADSIIDELKISNIKYTDLRIGESSSKTNIVTRDFNSVKPLKKDINTLVLIHFDDFPFENDSDVYITATKKLIQSGDNVNSNFSQSLIITENPINLENSGILNTKTEGTIEFWINPIYDTANDPNIRYFFDASSSISEEVESTSNGTLSIKGKASNILSVKLKIGNQNINYFPGGELNSNNQSIILGKSLPNQKMTVIVQYIPLGSNGDRLSIFKDSEGYLNFRIIANSLEYKVMAPIFWPRNTWHRVKASWKINGGQTNDEIRLFVDGFEKGNVLFGDGFIVGTGLVLGSTFDGYGSSIVADISFKDLVNEVWIGSNFSGLETAYALIDNLKISNISRPIYKVFGEGIDVNYSSNESAFPVTIDLNTALLLDFDTLVKKAEDFAMLKNKKNGNFDFTINIFDSFNIIKSSDKVKQILETLIKTLKPANSRAFLRYID